MRDYKELQNYDDYLGVDLINTVECSVCEYEVNEEITTHYPEHDVHICEGCKDVSKEDLQNLFDVQTLKELK